MTSPNLAVSSDFGRLYMKPGTGVDAVRIPEEGLAAGLLCPSVTNVIDVLGKPFLQTWYAREAAKAAVEVSHSHPNSIREKPRQAEKWISEAAPRKAAEAATLGDEVHNALEKLILEGMEQELDISAKAKLYVKSWKNFVTEFQPEFIRVEATCFGSVKFSGGKLGYAGTADAIVKIGNKTYIVDWKTGRSVHTEAALQLSALAHAEQIVNSDETKLEKMPKIDGGLVVHITANGCKIYPVDVNGEGWAVFERCRSLWDFHTRNINSRAPLFIEEAALSIEDLEQPAPAVEVED